MQALSERLSSIGGFAVSDKVSGGISGAFDTITKSWPLILSIIAVVGYCYQLQDQVTDLKNTIAQMQSHNLLSRVQVLEDMQRNDEDNQKAETLTVQNNLQALQDEEHQLEATLSTISQQNAGIEAQMGFLIKNYKPDGP